VGLGVVPAAAAAHRAADRGRRGGAVLGERPGAPGGAAAVGRGGAAAVLPAASAHSGHREEHLRAPASRDLGLRFGIGGVARAAPQGLGAGRGGARRDAGGGGGLADAGERDREREEVVGAPHVGAEAGGDAVPDGGHLLGFLVLAPLPSPPRLALVLVRCGGRARARLPPKKLFSSTSARPRVPGRVATDRGGWQCCWRVAGFPLIKASWAGPLRIVGPLFPDRWPHAAVEIRFDSGTALVYMSL
jgi:hypothetical protein